MENKKATIFLFGILCSILLGISIAYAVLSTTFKLTVARIPESNQIWDVGFEPGVAIPTKFGTSGVVCGNAAITKDSVLIDDSRLTTLHDKCTYKLKIKNLGSIGASISTISPKTPTDQSCTGTGAEMVCGNIKYSLAMDEAGTKLLTNNKTLAPLDGELEVYFIVEYAGIILGESANHTTAGFAVTYIQE